MLIYEVLLEKEKGYDLDIPKKFLLDGPDKGMFKKGRKGLIKHAVQQIQFFLNDNGYPAGKADGWYGKKTARAVRKFQQDKDLKPDGDVGKNTLLAMIEHGKEPLDPSPDSAEKKGDNDTKFQKREYLPVDYGNVTAYMANAFAKWYKGEDPRSAFQTRPDMPKSLKVALQSTIDSQQMDTKKKYKVGKQTIYVDHKTVDKYLYHAKRYANDPPRWVQTIAKALKDAVDYSRLDPKKSAEVRDALNNMKSTDDKPAKQAQAQATQDDLLASDVKKAQADIKSMENSRKRAGQPLTKKMAGYLSTFIHSKDNDEKYQAYMGYKKSSMEMIQQQQFGK